MKTKTISLFCLFMLVISSAWAQGPNNSRTYYQAANGKSGQALKTAMHSIITNNKKMISGKYDGLINAYKKTDVRSDGYLRDWYSNATHYVPGSPCSGNYNEEGDLYNREHLVPQSWFGTSDEIKCDIVHVVPADGKLNGQRSNNILAEVGTVAGSSINGYSKWGRCKTTGYTGTVFEPNDEVKGDIARIYFYMVTCYEGETSGWTNNTTASYVFDGNTYPGIKSWYLTMLMRWSKLDPIDDVEIARNNAIAASDMQNNRNPFVDYPGLEDYIWGDKTTEPFVYDNYSGGTIYVSAPSFSPEPGTYYTAQNVTISSPTEGATIYYAFGNGEYNVYNGEIISLSTTTTLKAYAEKDGEQSSTVAATYIIRENEIPPTGNTFVKVTSNNQIAVGNEYIFVNEGNKKAAGKLIRDYLDFTDVEIYNGIITLDNNSTASVFTLGGSSNGYSLKTGNQYLTSSVAKSLSLVSNESTIWSISSGDNGYTVSGNSSIGTIQYNAGSPRFLNYTSGQSPAVLYVRTNIDTRQEANISYTTTAFEVEEEKDFTAPVLNNPNNLTGITYSSSNEEVAMVNENTGAITIGKPGTAVITATFAGNVDFKEGTASYTITVTEKPDPTAPVENDVTFDFTTNGYGMTAVSGGGAPYNPNPTTISNDIVSLTMSGGNASRYWIKTDNSTELRVYKACTMTISVPEDSKIKKIVFAGATVSGILNNGKAVTTWTGKEQEVTFTFSGTQNINTINVTVETQQAIERKLGDVNGDGLVNIADVVALVGHILGNTPDVFYEDVADLNEDGNINISDAVNLVGIILSE